MIIIVVINGPTGITFIPRAFIFGQTKSLKAIRESVCWTVTSITTRRWHGQTWYDLFSYCGAVIFALPRY